MFCSRFFLLSLFSISYLILTDYQFQFFNTSNQLITDGYLIMYKSGIVSYEFPSENATYNISGDKIKKQDSIFFHSNFSNQRLYLSDFEKKRIVINNEALLEAVILEKEVLSTHGIKSRRGWGIVNKTIGYGYSQKIDNKNRAKYLKSVEFYVLNKALFRNANSNNSTFRFLIGQTDSLQLAKPHFLPILERDITVNSTKSGWIKVDLEEPIALERVKYLFLGMHVVKGRIDLGLGTFKEKNGFNYFGYSETSYEGWRNLPEAGSPMIRYTLSNKAF